MAKTVTANYETEEARSAGAIPKFYVGFMRTKKTLDNDDYSDGTHTNTEINGSDQLVLSSGKTSGNWVSAALDSAHLTPNIIFDLITWDEGDHDGTVTLEIRTASTSGGLTGATYVEYTDDTLDHTERYRYYQIKISLTKVSDTPEVENVVVRHKALIPTDEYISLGSINYGIDYDFNSIVAGGATLTFDNSSHQWETRNTGSYIYGLIYFFGKIDIWAGFDISGSTEWTQQFIGELESIQVSSGDSGECRATITARDFLYRKLTNTKIGRPASSGTPNPYMSGKRYRVPCIETDTVSHIFSFYCQQSISSIDAVYTKSSGSNNWDTASPSSTSAANKTVTFASDPGADVAVDITIDSNEHPCDIITDIITNELSLASDEYDAASITTTKTNTNTNLAVGVNFENMSVMEAFTRLGQALDAAIFIEGGVLKVVSFYPDVDESFSFTDSDHKGLSIVNSTSEVQNTAGIFYDNYDFDKTKYKELSLSDSITDYGELSRQDFSYKFSDPISLTDTTYIGAILAIFLGRQDDQFEILSFNLPLEILRIEIMDIISLTASKHSISGVKVQVYNKTLNLDDYTGSVTCIYYPNIQWLYWNDASPTEDLRYLVDDPVPTDQIPFKSYYYG